MKRVVLMGIVLGVAASLAFGAGEVRSVNAVGYVKQNVVTGFNLLGFSLDPVGTDTTKGVPVDQIMGDQMTGDLDPGLADNVLLWDPVGQVYIGLWKYDDGSYKAWLDSDGNVATNVLFEGDAFWVLNRHGSQDLSLAGQVVNMGALGAIKNKSFLTGFNFFSYPFSSDKALANTDLANDGAHGAADPGLADNVIAWDKAIQQYVGYWLYYDVTSGPDKFWLDSDGNLASLTLSFGQGCWYLRRPVSSFTWSEPQPYDLNN